MSEQKANEMLNVLRSKTDAGDIDGGKLALAEMKILMLDFPIGNDASEVHTSIAASALELGVLISVADEDLDAFARNVSQLKQYYSGLSSTPADSKKCHILGLNLMYLLVENNLSEFHAELELLSTTEASSPFVSFPITLERQLMVGSYDEVLRAGSQVPDASYKFFMENLLQTVRDSIADCLEVSYKTMKMADAVNVMKFDNREELQQYVEECRDDWLVVKNDKGEDVLCFQPPEGGSKASDIPSMKLIAQTLSYATELERII